MTRFAAAIGLALAVSVPAHADWTLNLRQGVTPVSHDIYSLHMMVFTVCVLIGIGVFSVIFWSILRHRKSKGAVAAQFHESTTVEVVWTIVPFLILVAMAIPAAQTLVEMEDVSHPDLTVKVTGYQWMWHYQYVGQGVGFYSKLSTPRKAILNEEKKPKHYLLQVDHQLVLPVGEKIRFLQTSGDVIHSWWVPALGVKKDAIPGYVNQNWARIEKPGIYRGQCAELCGRGHGYMPIVIRAVPRDQFEAWLQKQKEKQKGQAEASAGDGDSTVVASNQ